MSLLLELWGLSLALIGGLALLGALPDKASWELGYTVLLLGMGALAGLIVGIAQPPNR